jgi:hypothetical protein
MLKIDVNETYDSVEGDAFCKYNQVLCNDDCVGLSILLIGLRGTSARVL